jgi:hypothetical protein
VARDQDNCKLVGIPRSTKLEILGGGF